MLEKWTCYVFSWIKNSPYKEATGELHGENNPGFWDYLYIYCSLFFFSIVQFISMNITIYRLTFTLRFAELPQTTRSTWLLEFGKNSNYKRHGKQNLFSSYGFSLENYCSPRASQWPQPSLSGIARGKKPPLYCRTHEWVEWSVSH